MAERKNGLTYADSGVDIDAGNRLVDLIKPMVRATARPGADAYVFIGDVTNQESVERAVSELRPGAVYVTHGGNLHVDHQTAYRAAATALRPVPGSPVTAFHAYEIASSTAGVDPERPR